LKGPIDVIKASHLVIRIVRIAHAVGILRFPLPKEHAGRLVSSRHFFSLVR
jgi:hypothetical protein